MDALVVAWIATGAAQAAVLGFGWFLLRPLVRTWNDVRRAQNEMVPILREVVAHVRTDSGTSLLDIVQRLDSAAKAQVQAAEIMSDTLARMEGKADQVADDLAESQQSADDAIARGEEAGVASDEASATPDGDDPDGQG